jgi:hypothetical protein
MDVNGHQAITQDAPPMTLGLLAEQRQVKASLDVAEEDLLAAVPPLRDVLRYAHRDHACGARHAAEFGRPPAPCQY